VHLVWRIITGSTYVWQVQVYGLNGSDTINNFKNNGNSEIWTFTYNTANCSAPSAPTVSEKYATGLQTTWTYGQGEDTTQEFQIRYRIKDGDRWYDSYSSSRPFLLSNLKSGTVYEIKRGLKCTGTNGYTYSNTIIDSTLSDTSTKRITCGISAEDSITNTTPLTTLAANGTFKAGKFTIHIDSIGFNSGDNTYTGYGHIQVPWLYFANLKVNYTGIKVNTDGKLFSGVVVTSWDPTMGNIADLDKLFEGGGKVGDVLTGDCQADVTITTTIKSVDDIKVGSITTNADGDPIADVEIGGMTFSNQPLPFSIQDGSGSYWAVDKDGKKKKVGETLKITDAALKALSENIDPTKYTISFEAISSAQPVNGEYTQYALDNWISDYSKSNLWNAKYEEIKGVHIGSKCMAPAKPDIIKVTIAGMGSDMDPDQVKFITGKGVSFTYTRTSNTYIVNLLGGPGGDAQELYVSYGKASSGGANYQSYGKLKLAAYKIKTIKVALVPVGSAAFPQNITAEALQIELNKIYNPVCVKVKVRAADKYENTTWNGGLKVEGSGLFSSSTDDMKEIEYSYKNSIPYFEDEALLFIMPKLLPDNNSNMIIEGDMPRSKQIAYLNYDAIKNGTKATNEYWGRLIAHELAHGIFRLRHSFDNDYCNSNNNAACSTFVVDNLMNRNAGVILSKFQWDAMHDPAVVIGLFENESNSQSDILNIENLLTFIKQNTNSIVKFKRLDFNPHYTSSIVPLFFKDEDQREHKVYVQLGLRKEEDIDLTTNDQSKFTKVNLDIKLKYKIHVGFYLNINYKNSNEYAIRLWCYDYQNYAALLEKLGMFIPEGARGWITDQYKTALKDAGNDCNILDVIYETMPPFVIGQLDDQTLFNDLKILANCTMGSSAGTDEEMAALNILNGIYDREWLYKQLYDDPNLVMELFNKFDGDNVTAYCEIIRILCADNSYYMVPWHSSMTLGEVVDDIMEGDRNLKGDHYILTIDTKYDKNAQTLNIEYCIGRANWAPWNWGSVEVHKTLTGISRNPLDPVDVSLSANENTVANIETLPLVYAYHLGYGKNMGELLEAVNKGVTVFGVASSIRLLFTKGISAAGRFVAIADLTTVAIDQALKLQSVKNLLNASPEGQWFLDKWPIISIATNVSAIGFDILYNIRKNRAIISKALKDGGKDDAVKEFDNIADEVTKILGTGKYIRGKYADIDNFIDNITTTYSKERIAEIINGFEEGLLTSLNKDLKHSKWGKEIKELIEADPDDLSKIYKTVKEDPSFAWEMRNSGDKWEKWAKKEFFTEACKKGKYFEEEVVLRELRDASSKTYKDLKQKIAGDHNINLDDYEVFSQTQLTYNGADYFIADQVFVKVKMIAGKPVVQDLIVIENKLSKNTKLTINQSDALTKSSYTLRSVEANSRKLGSSTKLKNGTDLSFQGNKIKWYKVYDSGEGKVVEGIQKM
jgi:hypothetical protein